MSERCSRAVKKESSPEVVAWAQQLEQLVRDMPPGVSCYVASNTIEVMDGCAEGYEGNTPERHRHLVTSVNAPRWDGGDW